MITRIILSAILATLVFARPSQAREFFWTIGPMVHLNFGGGGHSFSYSLEGGVWTKTGLLPQPFRGEPEAPFVGINFGAETDRSRLRLYSEAQYGFYAGASAGPYLEFQADRMTGFGVQGSVWGAMVLGLDLRARYGTRGFFLSPGAMAKIGHCLTQCELH